MSIRERVIRDSRIALGDADKWGVPVELVSPSAIEYLGIHGRVVYSDVVQSDDGNEIIVNDPVVSIHLEDLERVPETGEKWIVRIPEKIGSETMVNYTCERPVEINKSIGFITLRLVAVEQS
jgi:hypothetical protein